MWLNKIKNVQTLSFSILVIAYSSCLRCDLTRLMLAHSRMSVCDFGGTCRTPVTPPSPFPLLRGQIGLFKSEPWKHEIEEQRPEAEAGSEGASLVFKINTKLWVSEWGVLVFHTLPLPLPLLVLLIHHSLLSPFSSTLSQEMEDSRGRTGQGQPWLVSTKRTQTTASSAKGELFFSWVFQFFPFFNWRLNLLKV